MSRGRGLRAYRRRRRNDPHAPFQGRQRGLAALFRLALRLDRERQLAMCDKFFSLDPREGFDDIARAHLDGPL